ncbi:hypothetical protein A6769_27420 [Nostoc punctiforme NIES-2108]|uniref:Group 3/4 sigma-70 RNA polymerase sigma factor n=1 Tax=Nostoc punctiforme NIES-2108 TaxID=1356359 RepID=A0A367R7X8_NOSPU|nr:hypothetical protein A6769_27420 [Nostoc punctiforme NIES-2108]
MIVKRKTLVEMFSTFLKIVDHNNYPVLTWQTDPRLKRNIEDMIAQDPAAKEEIWARYWLQEALQNRLNSLAKGHINFYLEETFYWVARKIKIKFTSNDLTWMDYWQIARAITATELIRVLGNYDFNSTKLKTYAQMRITTVVLDKVRVGRDLNKYSDWALLRNITKKSLRQALQKININEQQESPYLLAWSCFKEIYVPSTTVQSHRLSAPSSQQLTMMAERYNQLRSPLSISEDISHLDIKKLLETCIQAVRDNSKTPVISSLDAPNITVDNLLIQIPDDEEEDENVQSLNQVLVNAFNELPADKKNLLILNHGLELIQADIGQIFNLKQYQVAREIKRLHKLLLQELAEWGIQNLGITLTLQEIDQKSKEMYRWLIPYCKGILHQFLQALLTDVTEDVIAILKLRYGRHLNQEQVALELQISEDLISLRLAQVKENLQLQFQEQLQDKLGINLASILSANRQIMKLVNEWLNDANHEIFEM